MRYNPGLGVGSVGTETGSARLQNEERCVRCEFSIPMPKDSRDVWLIKRKPVLDTITVSIKAEFGVAKVVWDNLAAVPTVVLLLQG